MNFFNISLTFFQNRTGYFPYDIEGNVSSILIDVPHDSIVHQRYKRINYYYDLVSGNVDEVIYEPDSIDQFIHLYQYDADNRITDVMTSRDSLYWENDASYEYYDHGPVAREVIGQRQVQGIDYAYTLNKWIKAVNSGLGSYKKLTWPNFDMGKDGFSHGSNATIGRDAYGYVINYFTGDYRSIAKTYDITTGLPTTDLYNGNISGATYAIRTLSPAVIGYTYGYDQLNRMVSELAFKGIDTAHNLWVSTDSIKDFREKVNYDDNGNILSYLRHGNTAVGSLAMDSLTYHYNLNTNQLREVNDAVSASNYSVDIDNETSKHNYRYNGIGELASDSIAGIDSIYWTVYNKVKKIVKTNNDSIVFMYDPMGNRLEQRNFPHSGTADTIKYTRDTKGNIVAIYDRKKDTVRLSEFDIYGDRRLGSLDTTLRMQKFITGHGTLDSLTIAYLERQKQYELYNQLGSVLVTVSDGKTPIDTLHYTGDTAGYYLPIVVNAQDYYPFGMTEPGRSYTLANDSSYKYGYQGSMKDNSIYGATNVYTTQFRELDPRLGKWWSTDPVVHAGQSPYLSMGDNPIFNIDPNGNDNYTVDKKGIISLKEKTKDKTDKLLALDDKGKVQQNKFITVPKGILNQKQSFDTKNDKTGKPETTDYYNIKNDAVTTNLFIFLAHNTTVEWEVDQIGDKKGKEGDNILSTTHAPEHVTPPTYNIQLRQMDHDHPSAQAWGNINGPSVLDVSTAKYIQKMNSNAVFKIYYPSPDGPAWQTYDSTGPKVIIYVK